MNDLFDTPGVELRKQDRPEMAQHYWSPDLASERLVGKLDRIQDNQTFPGKLEAVFSVAALFVPSVDGLVTAEVRKDARFSLSVNVEGLITERDAGRWFAVELTGWAKSGSNRFRVFRVAAIPDDTGKNVVAEAALALT